VLIGTWNLDAKWTRGHGEFLAAHPCDVWLLTEVSPRVQVPGYSLHVTAGTMARGQAWAGVLTRLSGRALPEPHPASVAVEIAGHAFCASVLPWAGCGNVYPWHGDTVGAKTADAVGDVVIALPVSRTVWGGDWNHTLVGNYYGSSRVGRLAILAALDALGLVCRTSSLPHRLPDMTSIDHLAVPIGATTQDAHHVAVPSHLSDHDAYVLDLQIF
jgi:hypothetical protein